MSPPDIGEAKPKRGRPPKRPDEPVSLAPLEFEEALRDLMATGPHGDEGVDRAGEQSPDETREGRV